jgi:cytochrome c553
VQQVELASRPPGLREEQTFKLYLLSFEQACNDDGGSCSSADLYTPRIESDWRRVQIRDEAELSNTALDCRRASPVDALIQACGACHNDVLDQSISRASFNIDLSRMGRAERDIAIERIERKRSSPGAMPPVHARQLPERVAARLVDYLRNLPEGQGDERLKHAAMHGMSGGARPRR